jgi:hypothetical protein
MADKRVFVSHLPSIAEMTRKMRTPTCVSILIGKIAQSTIKVPNEIDAHNLRSHQQ